MRSSKVSLRFVVGISSSLSTVMLWLGKATACHGMRMVQCGENSKQLHRALKEVSTTLLGVCFLPSFSFAF